MNTLNNLSRYQKRTLEFYLFNKDKKLSMTRMWFFNAKLYLWTFGIFSSVILLFYLFIGVWAASFVASAFSGLLLRDFGTFRKSIANWPLLNEIIDWDKATLLLTQAKKEALEK